MRKYSTVRASAKELGGMMQTSPVTSTKDFSSKFFGSTMVRVDVGEDLEFVRAADVVAVARGAVGHDPAAVDLLDLPGSNGSIMPCSCAMRRIHLSDLMLMAAL